MFCYRHDNFVFGLSNRVDGPMMVSQGVERIENRRKFFTSLNIDPNHTVIAGLVHGAHVQAVSASDRGCIIEETDGLITNKPETVLTITASDCLPIYFFDTIQKTAGLAHAGWRGTRSGIAGEMIACLTKSFGSVADDIHVVIGPHIRSCHFEVLEDVAREFADYKECIKRKNGRIFIDLASVVTSQLITAGVKKENINISKMCTYEEAEAYFSYRRDKPAQVEAMVAYMQIV